MFIRNNSGHNSSDYPKILEKRKNIQLVVPEPTFNYAELYAKPLDITICKVPLPLKMKFDLCAMQNQIEYFNDLSLVYLYHRNNPTAIITHSNQLDNWIAQLRKNRFFLINEAYTEYVDSPNVKSTIKLIVVEHQNIIIMRTLSKIYALAVLRIGYGIVHPETIANIESFISTDNINYAKATTTLISLKDTTFLTLNRDSKFISQNIITTILQELNIDYPHHKLTFFFIELKKK